MSREAIFRIREIESEAAETIRRAQAQADRMRADAESSGEALCREAEENALEERRALMAQLTEKSDEMMLHAKEESEAEAEALLQEVRMRRKIAEKIIIRGLDSKCR
jgi:vacuolar-type H+-ATPase subunit H